jgi:hypothetical protein
VLSLGAVFLRSPLRLLSSADIVGALHSPSMQQQQQQQQQQGAMPVMGAMGNAAAAAAPAATVGTMHAWLQNLVDGANGALKLLTPHWQRWRQYSQLPTAEELEDLVVALENKLESTLSRAFDQLDAYLGVRNGLPYRRAQSHCMCARTPRLLRCDR